MAFLNQELLQSLHAFLNHAFLNHLFNVFFHLLKYTSASSTDMSRKCIKHGQVNTALNQGFRRSVSYEVGLRCTNQVVVSVQVSQMPQVNCCKHAINYH